MVIIILCFISCISIFIFFLIIFEFVFIYFLDDGEEEEEEGEQDNTPAEEDETLASGTIDDSLFSNFTPSQSSQPKDDGYNSDGTPFLGSQSTPSPAKNTTHSSSPAPSPTQSTPNRSAPSKPQSLKKPAAPRASPIDPDSFLAQLVIFFFQRNKYKK